MPRKAPEPSATETRLAFPTSGADLTFATRPPRARYANVKSKLREHQYFSNGPLILTLAKVPAETGCEC